MATKLLKTMGEMQIQTIRGQTANDTVVVPAGFAIQSMTIRNTTANAVTGGVRVGTTDGGVDVVVALATGANAIIGIPDATILLKYFSATVDTTLYIQAVAAWNSANLDINIVLVKVN